MTALETFYETINNAFAKFKIGFRFTILTFFTKFPQDLPFLIRSYLPPEDLSASGGLCAFVIRKPGFKGKNSVISEICAKKTLASFVYPARPVASEDLSASVGCELC